MEINNIDMYRKISIMILLADFQIEKPYYLILQTYNSYKILIN